MGVTTSTNSASTYTPIASFVASGSASSITFSSIPSTYTDLVLVCNVTYSPASLGANTGYLVFRVGNGSVDTGTNYSQTNLGGNGSTAASNRATNQTFGNLLTSITGSQMALTTASIQNYSNTTTYKTIINRTSEPSLEVEAEVILWRSTSAINIIQVYDYSGYNFSNTSTFTLYGIKAA